MVRKGTEKEYFESEAERFREAKERHSQNGNYSASKKAEEYENKFRSKSNEYNNDSNSSEQGGCLGLLLLLISIPILTTAVILFI